MKCFHSKGSLRLRPARYLTLGLMLSVIAAGCGSQSATPEHSHTGVPGRQKISDMPLQIGHKVAPLADDHSYRVTLRAAATADLTDVSFELSTEPGIEVLEGLASTKAVELPTAATLTTACSLLVSDPAKAELSANLIVRATDDQGRPRVHVHRIVLHHKEQGRLHKRGTTPAPTTAPSGRHLLPGAP